MRSEHGLRRPRFLVRALAFTSILGAAASGCGSRSSWSASDASDSGLNVLDANSDRLDESDTPAPWSPDLAADLTWDCGSSDFDSWSLDVGPRTLDPPDVAVAADLPQEVDAPPNMPDAAFAADISVQPLNPVLGTVRTFASAPALGTVVGFPSQERVLFLTGNLLTLAKINNDQLEVLDRAQWGSSVSSFQISSMIWVFRSTAFIVPLSPTRVAVVGADWSIDLYDIGQDRLQPSYRFGFGAGNRSLTAITTSQGKNLWTCMNTNIRRYQIDDVQQYIRQDPAFRLPTDHLCYGLSVSSDGRTLLAATSSGLDVVDISIGDGTGTLQQTVLSGDFLVDVVSNGQEIGVYRIDDATNGVGTVRTLAAADYTPIATFASSGNIIEAGFTMMAGGTASRSMGQHQLPGGAGCFLLVWRQYDNTDHQLCSNDCLQSELWKPSCCVGNLWPTCRPATCPSGGPRRSNHNAGNPFARTRAGISCACPSGRAESGRSAWANLNASRGYFAADFACDYRWRTDRSHER